MSDDAEEIDELSELFKEDPAYITVAAPKLEWMQPCYARFDVPFRSSRNEFDEICPRLLPFVVDVFSKRAISEQVWDRARYLLARPKGEFEDQWREIIYRQFETIRPQIDHISSLFTPPFRYVARTEFERVPIVSVLRQRIDEMEVYLVLESTPRPGGELSQRPFVRIHSSLKYHYEKRRYLWFDKEVPWRLGGEDILPWFESLLLRLPKKMQPSNLSQWLGKLLKSQPQLPTPRSPPSIIWGEKPRIILVLGPMKQIGTSACFHLERSRISTFLRKSNEVTIAASIPWSYAKDPRDEQWQFLLVCRDEATAQQAEMTMLEGSQIHYSVGDAVTGMAAWQGDTVSVLNIDLERVKRFCCGADDILELEYPNRKRRKIYSIVKRKIDTPPSP
jgi:hypothetical protein